MKALIWRTSDRLAFWLVLDGIYLLLLATMPVARLPAVGTFLPAHAAGIAVGTLVMYTGVGAGVVWFPFFTLVGFRPVDAVSFSLFNQMAGKGSGSFRYLREGLVDGVVARRCIPWALAGVLAGYLTGHVLPRRYDRWLLLLFALVVAYLLTAMIARRVQTDADPRELPESARASRLLAAGSSFFTGILSVGTSDWLIPHLARRLRMPVSRAVATGIFIMFTTAAFYWLLIVSGVLCGWRNWPANPPILFGTAPGVVVGAQIGSRLVRFTPMKKAQPYVFMTVLGLSAAHMVWEFFRRS
jgi:uncharacterized membrane protein YfcA